MELIETIVENQETFSKLMRFFEDKTQWSLQHGNFAITRALHYQLSIL